jgi:hypothetical protein
MGIQWSTNLTDEELEEQITLVRARMVAAEQEYEMTKKGLLDLLVQRIHNEARSKAIWPGTTIVVKYSDYHRLYQYSGPNENWNDTRVDIEVYAYTKKGEPKKQIKAIGASAAFKMQPLKVVVNQANHVTIKQAIKEIDAHNKQYDKINKKH